jgi:glycogen debranching enzyme
MFLSLLLSGGCQGGKNLVDLSELTTDLPSISGKEDYINSPFVTAGDRTYMVGHQNGSFPEIGWHIEGEMGGIWNHPIKLMDGFDAKIISGKDSIALNRADKFVNYPFANAHHYSLDSHKLAVQRLQFVPDNTEGMVVQFQFKNTGTSSVAFQFELTGHTDLRPTWLGEKTGMVDGADQAFYQQGQGIWLAKDAINPWAVAFGTGQKPVSKQEGTSSYRGKGRSVTLRYQISIGPGQTNLINLYIAGSYNSSEAALATYRELQANYGGAFKAKKIRYGQLATQSKLSIPDPHIQQTFEWLKYNCDWMVRNVPEIGSGITAGIPDYPWWFGVDSEYALKGYMAVGQEEPVYHTIALLDSVSMAVNGNGRILHEMSTNGAVFNRGNINETPQFASLIWEVYKWNGNKEFLDRYFPTVKKGLHWLLEENDLNRNLFPDGFGMMEIHGLNSEMIDVAAYTQRAFSDASKMAGHLGETVLETEYRALAEQLKEKINKEFWSASFKSYADFLGTDEQALRLIADAVIRADTLDKPWAIAELEKTAEGIRKSPAGGLRPFVVHHNWVVNTPMEMNIADSTKALQALKTAENFVNPFGLFVTGIDRDETAGADEGSFKGAKVFSYTGAVMTLPTGVLAVAENNYGRTGKALEYLERMSQSFSFALPGSMYEVSPDYGMICQAWNIYGYAIPIVQQFFGINPEAYDHTVTVKPNMPEKWENASLENVKVADNEVSVYFGYATGNRHVRVTQTNTDWTLNLVLPYQVDRRYEVIGEGVTRKEKGRDIEFTCTGTGMEIRWEDK